MGLTHVVGGGPDLGSSCVVHVLEKGLTHPVIRAMPGLINFRDFGGYVTETGRSVRKDRLYRCGHLAELNDEELEHIIGLDFAVIADLRYAGEREAERSPWPQDYFDRIIAHGEDRKSEAPHLALMAAGAMGPEAVDGFYLKLNRELPYSPLYRPLFARTLERIADTDGRALIHCAAGKDRTGILAALILHVLGAPRETIVADYLLSSQSPGLLRLKPRIIERVKLQHGFELREDVVDAWLDARRHYIETAFEAIEAESGSIEAYLAESGVDEAVGERLRERLLEPTP